MNPHPRIRKTVKWGGAAATMLLVVVWIESGWYGLEHVSAGGKAISVRNGCVSLCTMRGVLPSAMGTEWLPRTHFEIQWGMTVRSSHSGAVLSIPIWWFASTAALFTAIAWQLAARARARAGSNQCETCGYDRTGLAAGAVCPECGAASASAYSATSPHSNPRLARTESGER